jgi:ICP0-binding domain of Ubiquitin-specific protease 7
MERAEDIWYPTVAVLPKRVLPPAPMLPARYSDESKDAVSTTTSSGGSSYLSNGDIGSSVGSVEWPDVGKLPGLYTSRHDANMIFLFLKHFDVETQTLSGVKPVYVHRQDKTGKLTSVVAEMMNWTDTSEGPVSIAFYEEIRPGWIDAMKPNATFRDIEIQDGDIICFMRQPSPKRYAQGTWG